MTKKVQINTISELHQFLGLPKPTHPLVTLVDQSKITREFNEHLTLGFGLYFISLKDGANCSIGYGQTTYDFDTGTMTFFAPEQEVSIVPSEHVEDSIGWMLAFHPQLIAKSDLYGKMLDYTFFEYESNEALHLSERERTMVTDIALNIGNETEANIDKHTQSLICSNIELLLKYCNRFYDRQFIVRADLNHDHIHRLSKLLADYYQGDRPFELGIPTVQYCGKELGLSPYYLSDLLKKETGKNALEHIHLFVIERAKTLMAETEHSITQIGYE
ncbi:helix-turn-helix domain-containing protein, partial [Vibrio fortis]